LEVLEGVAIINQIVKYLQRDGHNVNKKLLNKVIKYMGIKALYPNLNMTIDIKEHYKYSYLLKEFRNDKGQVIIKKVNQVYLTDMNTYSQDKIHSAIHYHIPNEVYFQGLNNTKSKGDEKL